MRAITRKGTRRAGWIEAGEGFIPLTLGLVARVDPEMVPILERELWHARKSKAAVYAVCRHSETRKLVPMHRFIMGNPEGMQVDHANGGTLDNRRANLRVCTHTENAQNARKMKNRETTSRYKGVYWNSVCKKWQAYIGADHKSTYLGVFRSEEAAARAYNRAALERFGEFASLNEVEDGPDEIPEERSYNGLSVSEIARRNRRIVRMGRLGIHRRRIAQRYGVHPNTVDLIRRRHRAGDAETLLAVVTEPRKLREVK